MNIILKDNQIQQKITRLAYQVLEHCFEEPQIFIGGISGNGYLIALKIKEVIANSSVNQKVEVFEIQINKKEPWSDSIALSIDDSNLKNGYIIIVDDVINSGKTMQYALVRLLQQPSKSIKTVALVDRTHRRYPIKADYVGLSLSTTLKERVDVILADSDSKAFLI